MCECAHIRTFAHSNFHTRLQTLTLKNSSTLNFDDLILNFRLNLYFFSLYSLIYFMKEVSMDKEVIHSDKAPKAIGPYSQGVKTGNFLFTAGQIPLHPDSGEIVTGDIQVQTERVMENLKGVLEEAGGKFDDILKTTIYMTDLKEFGEMNEVYGRYFQKDPPARSTVEVRNLPKEVKIEIEAIVLITS